jgi:hypothetical protein
MQMGDFKFDSKLLTLFFFFLKVVLHNAFINLKMEMHIMN